VARGARAGQRALGVDRPARRADRSLPPRARDRGDRGAQPRSRTPDPRGARQHRRVSGLRGLAAGARGSARRADRAVDRGGQERRGSREVRAPPQALRGVLPRWACAAAPGADRVDVARRPGAADRGDRRSRRAGGVDHAARAPGLRAGRGDLVAVAVLAHPRPRDRECGARVDAIADARADPRRVAGGAVTAVAARAVDSRHLRHDGRPAHVPAGRAPGAARARRALGRTDRASDPRADHRDELAHRRAAGAGEAAAPRTADAAPRRYRSDDRVPAARGHPGAGDQAGAARRPARSERVHEAREVPARGEADHPRARPLRPDRRLDRAARRYSRVLGARRARRQRQRADARRVADRARARAHDHQHQAAPARPDDGAPGPQVRGHAVARRRGDLGSEELEARRVDGDIRWGRYRGEAEYELFVAADLSRFGCSCPSDLQPCKHVVALALVAERTPLSKAPSHGIETRVATRAGLAELLQYSLDD
jgi:hypothetical protein